MSRRVRFFILLRNNAIPLGFGSTFKPNVTYKLKCVFVSIVHLLILIACLGRPALSAEFMLGGDQSLNCVITISGLIQPGDAERFRESIPELGKYLNDKHNGSLLEVLHSFGQNRICLNSPGGDIDEAIRIADTLAFGYRISTEIEPLVSGLETNVSSFEIAHIPMRMGTAIPSGSVCESACAIIFMAGGFFSPIGTTDNVREPDRVLHVDGKLGFHAPNLRVPNAVYTKDSVLDAFEAALRTSDKLSNRLQRYRFAPSLFGKMISTPPSDLYYVDTVEKAASWLIQVSGSPELASPTLGNLRRVCENMASLSRTRISGANQYSNTAPVDIRRESVPFFGFPMYLGHEISNTQNTSRYAPETEHQQSDSLEIDEFGCRVRLFPKTKELLIEEIPPVDHGVIPVLGTYNWAMFPGYMKLEELSEIRRSMPSQRVPGDHLLSPVTDYLSGRCHQYSASLNLVLSKDCTAVWVSRQRADRYNDYNEFSVVWPDGADLELPPFTSAKVGDAMNGWKYIGRVAYIVRSVGNKLASQAPNSLDEASFNELGGGLLSMHCYKHEAAQEVRCFKAIKVTDTTVSLFSR